MLISLYCKVYTIITIHILCQDSVMSVNTMLIKRIERMQRGIPFTINGFYKLGSLSAVQKAFSRLASEGTVTCVSKGIYVRPKPLKSLPSIKITISAKQIARAWAKRYGYKLVSQGLEEAYRIGLQTQAPIKTIYWSNGPARKFNIGNELVEIRHITANKLRWEEKPEGILLRSMSVTPASSVATSKMLNAFKRLSLSNEEAIAVVHKLKSSTLSQAWQEKLKQLEDLVSYAHS